MKHHYLLAIGAGLSLAVFTAPEALAQTELSNRPDPAAAPARPAAPYVAPAAPAPPPMEGYYPANAIGLEIGWGGPYGGLGAHYARMVSRNVDINAGLGIGLGGKIGVGARYFVRPDKQVSGYFGASVARSGRISNVDVTVNNEQANYSMNPSGVLHLRGGLRWQPGKVGLLGTVGYGLRFTGDPVVYNTTYYGQPSQQLRDVVNVLTPGGVEFSLGVLFGFGD
ncbi:hypothetical protein EJV47_25580 [Hymenobacter gummosus]|uniref:Outer membrane protein beta-barrel domain-containing protein n=1 Tax=Hymenobacter gummosus TaxID=1776032 RepID=A0A3S0K120_9BACT|nr:hypothetical protein [Hymenobacter gummosus]RTQ45252.1 hypothetical protein EJV47_25580 [Hymenobacter gummosus]